MSAHYPLEFLHVEKDDLSPHYAKRTNHYARREM
jgi:hypothetical protein